MIIYNKRTTHSRFFYFLEKYVMIFISVGSFERREDGGEKGKKVSEAEIVKT